MSNNLNIAKNLSASIVVFLVALPLALGISLASGAPSVVPGLIGCAVGGIVVGALAGAPLQVSGPAAGLTVIVFELVQSVGWEITCFVTFCAGVVQVIIGRLKLGSICLAISPSVVHGMLAGIGGVIAIAQVHIVFGVLPKSGTLQNLALIPQSISNLNPQSLIVGLSTILIILFWSRLSKLSKLVPSALVAMVATTIIANALSFNVTKVSIGKESILDSLGVFKFPDSTLYLKVIISIFTVAIVASIESLLCAVATDKLSEESNSDLNQELLAQGVGNSVSGLLGGLPVTGVVIRSTANIQSGATNRLSAIFHGFWIVFFVLFAVEYLELVPLSALAGLLVHVGCSLIKIKDIKELIYHKDLLPYVVTFLGVVFLNLLYGVALGIVVSLVILLIKTKKPFGKINIDNSKEIWSISFDGVLSFLTIPKIRNILFSIPEGKTVKLLGDVTYLDHSAKDTIREWIDSYTTSGGGTVKENKLF